MRTLFNTIFRNPEESRDRRKNRRTLRWQIQSIAIVGALGFFLFLTVLLQESKDRADLLQSIQDVRYPMQQSLLAAAHELDYIKSNLQHAIISKDGATLDTAMSQAASFRQHLHHAVLLDQKHARSLNAILGDFDTYFTAAHAYSIASISGDALPEEAASSSTTQENYTRVAGALNQLKERENIALATSVSSATSRANEALNLGLTTGLLTAGLLFFLAFITTRGILQRINSMVSSLKSIAVGDGDMNVRMPLTGSDEMTELAFWFNTFIGKLQQVTQESTREIKRLAFTDTLTNLPNRRMFLRCLESEIGRQKTLQNGKLAVMFLDLDNFKPVNDQLGHDAGDDLIRQVANRLINTVREDDIISRASKPEEPEPGQPVVARLAGDEFMLIIADLQSRSEAQLIAERIRLALLHPYTISGTQCSVGVSIGVCMSTDDATEADDLVTFADMAMYDAKNSGKNAWRFYDPKLRQANEFKTKMDLALKSAISRNELHILFQPKVRLHDGVPVGAEALLRWTHPDLGTFSPDQFIAQAESTGQICELDEWVLDQVFSYLEEWEKSGAPMPLLALNFSATQASRHHLIDSVKRIAGDRSHLARFIEIEITETSAFENLAYVEDNIRSLKAMDIQIAMDDFGAGHSSLTLLTRCEMDTLKIDKDVITQIHNGNRSTQVVESIIQLAKKLNVKTVAEGVEEITQATQLAQMGCDYGQGYLYSTPQTADEFRKWMQQQNGGLDKAA